MSSRVVGHPIRTEIKLSSDRSVTSGSLRYLILSEPFRIRFDRAVERTAESGNETVFSAVKLFRNKSVLLSEVREGTKSGMEATTVIGELCLDQEGTDYTRYPLLSFHTHPKSPFLCPSGRDWRILSAWPKRWSREKGVKVKPILMITRIVDGMRVESLLIQDKGDFVQEGIWSEPGNEYGFRDEKMASLYMRIGRLEKLKDLTTRKVVRMFTDEGFAAAAVRDFRQLSRALYKFEHNEIDIRPSTGQA